MTDAVTFGYNAAWQNKVGACLRSHASYCVCGLTFFQELTFLAHLKTLVVSQIVHFAKTTPNVLSVE